MPWPLSQDYNEAVQSPESSFADPELRGGMVATNALGLPMPCSGNFADVYRVTCPASKRSWAVKCFTRQIPGLQERYQQISRHLEKGKPSFIVDFTFLDRGIQMRGDWYPILKMQWVEGLTLNQFVKGNLDKAQVLDGLCQLFVKLATRLRDANIAHCDLQHGNVLLVPGDKPGSVHVRLVDYDGMCVPALTLLKSMEVGHPSYQHPERLREGIYSLEVDRFSHLVIYTALRSLMVGGKALWDKHDDGDNLLFRQADFEAPAKSRLFYELLKLDDPVVRSLAEQMIEAVRKPLDQTPLLEDLVGATPASFRVQPAVSSRPTMPEVPGRSIFAPMTRASDTLPAGRKGKASRDRKVLRWYGTACAVGLLGLVVGGFLVATRNKPAMNPTPAVGLVAMATGKSLETKPLPVRAVATSTQKNNEPMSAQVQPNPAQAIVEPQPVQRTDPQPKPAESGADPKATPKAPVIEQPVPGLLHHYRFEEGEGTQILDALTNSPDGTHNARYSTDVPAIGRENRFSLALDGTAVARFPQQVFVFHKPYGDATLDFWLKMPEIQQSGSVFWTRRDAANKARFNISVAGSGSAALIFDYVGKEIGRVVIQRPVPIPTNKWAHIAVIRKQNKGKSHSYRFFVNGKQAGSTLDQKPQLPAGVGWTLNGRDGWPFTGLIDEVRLWDRAIPMSVLDKH